MFLAICMLYVMLFQHKLFFKPFHGYFTKIPITAWNDILGKLASETFLCCQIAAPIEIVIHLILFKIHMTRCVYTFMSTYVNNNGFVPILLRLVLIQS